MQQMTYFLKMLQTSTKSYQKKQTKKMIKNQERKKFSFLFKVFFLMTTMQYHKRKVESENVQNLGVKYICLFYNS